MLETIAATVIGGLILLIIEYSTGWFSKRAADVRDYLLSNNDPPIERTAPRTSRDGRQDLSGITSMDLAEIVRGVTSDSSKVDLISNFINDIDGPISGEDAATILSSFSSSTDTIRALRIISSKLARPVSGQAAKQIINNITSSSSQAEAAEMLSIYSDSVQRRRRR